MRALLDLLLPRPARRRLVRLARALTRRPPVGRVDFGSLRRITPISTDWGFDRGTPVDRYYIDLFMQAQAGDVRGRVLELSNAEMTQRYGGARVTRSDVLNAVPAPAPVTLVGDLASGEGLPAGAFDCAIITQTMQFIYDVHGVVRTLHELLAPGGVALVTVPAITKISRQDMERWGQYWSFTSTSVRRLFEEAFAPDAIEIGVYGNVLAATAFLHGIAAEELTDEELLHRDPYYETLITVRAGKPA
jgi:SAM-dependent methyltransferase